MRTTAIVVSGVLAGLLALAGCGGDTQDADLPAGAGAGGTTGSGGSSGAAGTGGTGGTGGAAGVPLDQLPAKVIAMECGLITQCLGDLTELFLGGADCTARFGYTFEDGDWPSMKAAVDDGTVIYHGDKVQACLDAWEALGCDIFTQRAPDICQEALEGTVDEGGDCTLDTQCKGPLFCKVDASCPGTCSQRQAAGVSCHDDDECQNGLTCDDHTQTCETPRKAGDTCEGGQPGCELGMLCFGSDAQTSGTCTSADDVFASDLGADCNVQQGPWCKVGLSCVVESVAGGVMVARCRAPVASGAACNFGVPAPCPTGQYCDADIMHGQLQGTCVPLPADGESCLALGGFQPCGPSEVCDSTGVCRALARLDGACTENVACYSGLCDNGKCASTDACSVLKQ